MTLPNADSLLDRFDLILLDAYGVLVTSSGPIDGAKEFIEKARARKKDLRVLSNDCSRTRENACAFYRAKGFDFEIDEVINVGYALQKYFRDFALTGSRCAVLGTEDAKECVRRAGGYCSDILKGEAFDLVVIADDSGFDVLQTMNAVLTFCHRRAQSGNPVPVLVANPDLLYQKSKDAFGFTSGSLARLLEFGLTELNPQTEFVFNVLGKPAVHLFEMALASASVDREKAIMFGDQIHTDIKGANAAGIYSCLVGTGVTTLPLSANIAEHLRPKQTVSSLGKT